MAYSPGLWAVSAVTSSLHEGARKAGHARGDRPESVGLVPWVRGRMTAARYSPRRLRGLHVSAVCNDGQTTKSHSGRTRELLDRKSTRLNSSHVAISYAGFCLRKKNANKKYITQ